MNNVVELKHRSAEVEQADDMLAFVQGAVAQANPKHPFSLDDKEVAGLVLVIDAIRDKLK